MDVALSILAFIVAIGILVSVHEFGHFWVARRLGFKVQRFSIGFGKPLARFKGRDPDRTEYWLSSIPLGGYVKMLDEREGPVPEAERHRAFNNRPAPQRIAVLLAGPGFNFLFAAVAYWLLFVTGVPGVKPYVGDVTPGSVAEVAGVRPADVIESIGGEPTETWEHATIAMLDELLKDGRLDMTVRGADGDLRQVELDVRGRVSELTEPDALFMGLGLLPNIVRPPLLGELTEDGPADRAGLEPGDRVVSVDGREIGSFEAFAGMVRQRPGETVMLVVERGGERLELPLEVGSTVENGRTIGQALAWSSAERPPGWEQLAESLRAEQRYGPIEALTGGIAKTWDMSALTVRMLASMVVGDVSMRNISGPITIAAYAGDTAQLGLSAFLGFLAIVSISLGILNLLPVPLLDGGQIVYQVAEWIKGAPLSERAMVFGQQLGMLFMILLMGFVFYNDLTRVFN
ncbi:MAG: RIP metalloprotease RseP [Gammaproteobacteria bacterium]|nr:RIP metalloprotease RseP [Gammaproteobacteria bacterium]